MAKRKNGKRRTRKTDEELPHDVKLFLEIVGSIVMQQVGHDVPDDSPKYALRAGDGEATEILGRPK